MGSTRQCRAGVLRGAVFRCGAAGAGAAACLLLEERGAGGGGHCGPGGVQLP